MADKIVRSINGVRNIDKLSRNITTENDLISTTDGEVYVVTKKSYKNITNVETQDFEKLKTKVENLNNQSDTNTTDIVTLQTDVGNNTSEIGTLKTSTGNNTSEIETLKTSTGNNTSEIETLKTSTDNNTSEIETLKTSTDNNTSEIATLKTSTSNNETNIDTTQTLIEQLQTQIDDLKSKTKQYYTLFEDSAKGVGTTIPLNDNLNSFDLIYISGIYPVDQIFTETIMVKSLTDTITIGRTNLKDTTGVFLGAYEIKLTINNNQELEITNDVSWDELGSVGSGAGRNAFTITNIEGVK